MSFDSVAASAFLEGKETDFDEAAASAFLDQDDILDLPIDKIADVKKTTTGPTPSAFDEVISGANRFAAGANDILLDTLGLPGDAMNFILEKMGSERRVYGSESLRSLGSELQIGFEKGQEPDSALYKAGEYTGIGLAFLAPILKAGEGALTAAKAGQIVEPSAGVAKGVAQKITAPFISAPKTALTTELTGSFGAGIGAYYGEKEYGPTGEIIGGLVAGIPSTIAGAAIPKITNSLKKSLFPFTPAGAKPKAAARLQSLAETPRAGKEITEIRAKILPEAKIPPAKLSGDRHLIALHNKILESDPVLAHKMSIEQQATNALARKELEELGGGVQIESTQAYLQGRVNHIKGLINSRVDNALKNAKGSIDKLSPKTQRKVVNQTVNKQINAALSDARKVENEAWAKVDKKAFASTQSTKKAYQSILLDRTETSDPAEIPSFVREFLGTLKEGALTKGKLGRTETVKNLHNLRHRINTVVREEKAKDVPNWNKIRIMGEIQESILKDLQESPAAKDFDEALQISRHLNEKFRGGVIDVILGHEKTGGKIAPEISLESIKGGPKAAVQIKEVLAASPESFGMVEELVKLNMQQSGIADRNGRIIVSAAKKYLIKNEEVLDMFPDIRNSLNQAVGLEEKAARTVAGAKTRLGKVSGSIERKIAEAKPGSVLSTIMTAKNPQQKMKTIIRQSGQKGKKGIKNDIIDFLLKSAKTGRYDEHDMPILSGQKMSNAWKTNRKTLGAGLKKDEISRLEIIINTLKKNDDLDRLPEIGEIIKPDNRILVYAARIVAAKHGAAVGGSSAGASIQTASMASSAAKTFMDKIDTGTARELLKDAIQDADLFKALLSDSTKQLETIKAAKILNGWMVAHTVSTLEEK